MVTLEQDLSKDALRTAIRERISRNQSLKESRRIPARLHRVGQSVRHTHQSLGNLLGRPLAVALAAGLAVLFAGTSFFFTLGVSGNSEPVRAGMPGSQPPGPGSEGVRAPEIHRLAESVPPTPNLVTNADDKNSLAELAPGGTNGFMVRLGTFRNPLNAARLAETLERQSSVVHTDIAGNGLHTVAVGPFVKRAEAETAAQTIQQTLGLVPQILRHELP